MLKIGGINLPQVSGNSQGCILKSAVIKGRVRISAESEFKLVGVETNGHRLGYIPLFTSFVADKDVPLFEKSTALFQ